MRPRASDGRRRAAWRARSALLALLAILGWPALAAAGSLVVHVAKPDGKPLVGAVVMVHGPAGAAPAKPGAFVIDQVAKSFTPDLTVMPVGSTVTFPNSDAVSHQVYSFSPAKKFQLPLYRGTPYPPMKFDTAGIVTLGCNIHDDMIAYVCRDGRCVVRAHGTGRELDGRRFARRRVSDRGMAPAPARGGATCRAEDIACRGAGSDAPTSC